jgi:hypothetical protein
MQLGSRGAEPTAGADLRVARQESTSEMRFPAELSPCARSSATRRGRIRSFQGGTASVVLTGKIADTCSDTSLTGG